MELPSIGQQCSQSDCKQLDFLPLPCKCGKQFCTEHFNEHVKTCSVFIRTEVELKKFKNLYKCSRTDCDETSLVPIICGRCQQHFCIKHRHLTTCVDKDEKTLAEEKERYAAPVRQFNEAKMAVDKQVEHNLSEARRKGKNTGLVNKVQLMKIKGKAKGLSSIPIVDRVYFNVTDVKTSNETPVFVSKQWSVGRVIDAVADLCKMINNNNKSNEKKLRLFKKNTGELLTADMSDILKCLFARNLVEDGESLVMDYID